MHGYYSMCIYYFINFRSHQFFSLFSVHNDLSLLIFFFLRCTQTHPYTNKSTQTNQHRNTPTHKQTHIDKPTERQIDACGAWFVDRPVKTWSGSWIGRWRTNLGRGVLVMGWRRRGRKKIPKKKKKRRRRRRKRGGDRDKDGVKKKGVH